MTPTRRIRHKINTPGSWTTKKRQSDNADDCCLDFVASDGDEASSHDDDDETERDEAKTYSSSKKKQALESSQGSTSSTTCSSIEKERLDELEAILSPTSRAGKSYTSSSSSSKHRSSRDSSISSPSTTRSSPGISSKSSVSNRADNDSHQRRAAFPRSFASHDDNSTQNSGTATASRPSSSKERFSPKSRECSQSSSTTEPLDMADQRHGQSRQNISSSQGTPTSRSSQATGSRQNHNEKASSQESAQSDTPRNRTAAPSEIADSYLSSSSCNESVSFHSLPSTKLSASKEVEQPSMTKNLFGSVRTKTARTKLRLQQQHEHETMEHRPQIVSNSGAQPAASSTMKAIRDHDSPSGRPPRHINSTSFTAASQRSVASDKKRKAAADLTCNRNRQQQTPRAHRNDEDLYRSQLQAAPTHKLSSLGGAQRAGDYQMVVDHVEYLSTTISTNCETLSDISVALSSQKNTHTLQMILSDTIDLTLTLSDQRSRAHLYKDLRRVDHMLRSVIPPLSEALQRQRERTIGTNNGQVDDVEPNPEGLDEEASDADVAISGKLFEITCYLLHFLTLDCTLSEFGAAREYAGRTRDLYIKNPTLLQAIAQIVSLDPVTTNLRDKVRFDLDLHPAESPSGRYKAVPGVDSTRSESLASPGAFSVSSSQSSVDPTVIGRMRIQERKKLRKLSQRKDADDEDDLSFHSDSESCSIKDKTVSAQESKNVDTIISRVELSLPMSAPKTVSHLCKRSIGGDWDGIYLTLPLLALTRIILGKVDEADDTESTLENDSDSFGDDDDGNPLFRTNRLLRESDVLPVLASALGGSLVVLANLIDRDEVVCSGCCSHLQHRIHSLVSLLDGACLLDEKNRTLLCQQGFVEEFGGHLVVAVYSCLVKLLDCNLLLDPLYFGDVSHELLRLLTSLSHENHVAALKSDTMSLVGRDKVQQGPGTRILGRILRHLAEYMASEKKGLVPSDGHQVRLGPDREKSEKLCYDAVVFCLNTLTNLVESKACRLLIAETMLIGQHGGHDLFVTWLTRWLVQQTGSFREAVTESTFGASPSKHADKHLSAGEEEKLMIAGNGFVFLLCLMIEEAGTVRQVTERLRDQVWSEIPGENSATKVTFIKNTLKAFCNIYRLKVGDLAVAVVSPVKALMEQLDAIEWPDESVLLAPKGETKEPICL